MRIHTSLSPQRYIWELKQQMEAFTDFGMERFTGIILGRFFYITHHAGHEYNRRITNEKNRAMGFVRRRENGCEACFIRMKGHLDPISLLVMYLFSLLYYALRTHGEIEAPLYWVSLAVSLFVGGISAIQDSLTERGREGKIELLTLLRDPTGCRGLQTEK